MTEFRYANVEREMKMYGFDRMVKSTCRGCHGGCGVYVYVKDGKVAKIQGDPDHPINHGTLCSKGLAAAEIAYHPDRLLYPVKRVGPKGSGRWERITWDEALDTIADRINNYREKYGPESIVFGYGTGRENEAVIYRIANLLGSPNVLTAGHFCYGPRICTSIITCGTNPIIDYENGPKCIIMWGNNVTISNPDCYKGEPFSVALSRGAKLIVVDPRLTRPAARADIWLQLRPGTDAALALGMLNVIVNEKLYDKEFVENYTFGWDEFVKRVNEYPLEKVEKITWVPKEKIQAAARLFATTRPGAIQWGVAIEQQINCADNDRLLMFLMGLTGNIDAQGGQVLYKTPPIVNVGQFGAHAMLPREQAAKRLGGDRFRLAARFAIINPKSVWDAIIEEKPYPVKMLFFISSNPVVTRDNAKEVYKALEKVEFMAVADFFITPTAELADIVLPAATWLEMDYIGDFWKRHGYILARRKVVQIGECRSDHEMLNDLAHRIGQGQFWWDSFEGGLDYILEPMGMKWRDFKEMDYVRGEVRYKKYKEFGFSTPTRKFELYSTTLEKMGYDPLPQHREVPESPVSTPELNKEYPYILITGARQPGFFHTENRQVKWLRGLHRDPIVQIHPDTAAKEGIKEGDWVVIESPRGKIKQRAALFPGIDPRVVAAQHGWWFPEKKESNHGWDESNVNILTDNAYEGCDPAIGATNIRALLCKIYPYKDGGLK
ncbi:MAG TPA: molybdopterin-dependent oxidoreductase [Syntrophorhabdaceae bacterium]|nr:molybdopterin-dependent oxidoreductase [Syntrophorhabdaceae bacterium]HOL05720.1 molybdopterin-dependent oxidoreductase [Syntrophorhabdaceae bacterium]HON85852.1 molybdopterin-dependent oxidoreductase [Syntrophorhabdaceae bacterium]HOT42774.1 molybdopterin-dependent oxidoreductase [Syntrophorhabdaceae bacterium]HPC67226.1 molybdopterin-dependent oxidoreductase [Syntrophorhabdaceae bacterium]